MLSYSPLCLLAALACVNAEFFTLQRGKDAGLPPSVTVYHIPPEFNFKTFTLKELGCPYPYPKFHYVPAQALALQVSAPADLSTKDHLKEVTVKVPHAKWVTVTVTKTCLLLSPNPLGNDENQAAVNVGLDSTFVDAFQQNQSPGSYQSPQVAAYSVGRESGPPQLHPQQQANVNEDDPPAVSRSHDPHPQNQQNSQLRSSGGYDATLEDNGYPYLDPQPERNSGYRTI